ncbi:hypothetical protein P153DRAFT_390353 [Dothidotthia symphoricarpi CBS 119687]|uniref:Uncharacterized protein n=1 Tax=Dothidotthia symphoricarpi CBS 119687 TaxID=1392245 RepID=A0A6A6A106_9PLEO|nr:uncharacterized protein P153DRAFT_390353 [Dothidotthia symphoricarpi CBS 119687]KAF2124885.1 hypothetical protein P153DRAFT_390353 [Dothidotthia symphoricarpi CBS 119687]
MEKIKSVLSGHKKTDDSAHQRTESSTSQNQHPIHDQMVNREGAQPTAHGAQGLSNVGGGQHFGTDGPIGSAYTPNTSSTQQSYPSSSTSSGPTANLHSNVRPQAPQSAVSEASIKSGVIGFGPSGKQGHAALPHDNSAENNLNRDQILGSGNAGGVTGEQSSMQPTTLPHPGSASRGQQDTGLSGTATDRSFPLSGGVATHGNQPATTQSIAHDPTRREQDGSVLGGPRSAESELPITEQDRTGLLAGVRPFNNRTDTSPHIPGEFPDPTPAENPSKTFFDQGHPDTTTTTNAPTTQHELRHTGSLDQPRQKSGDFTPDQPRHHGRDAAIAGGVGAAGLGAYAGSQKNDSGSGSPYGVSSPYSSTKVDPRVYGRSPPPQEQKRFEPLTRTEPPVSREEPKHHYGRDATALGTGAIASGAPHSTSQRDYAPDARRTAPASTVPTTQQSSKAADTFYGTPSAPAPRVDNTHTPSSAAPSSSVPFSSQPKDESQHHYGRDAALGGAGLATAGGLHHASQRDERADTGPASSTIGHHQSNVANVLDPRVQPDPSKQVHHNVGSTQEDPASKTIGPHSSNIANILDPRVKPDPAKQKGHTTSGPHQSDTLNRLDPKVDEKTGVPDQHHLGRDAALVGGAGAAGFGGHEAAKAYGDHRSTQPEASMLDQRYDPTATGAHASNPNPTYSDNSIEPHSHTHGHHEPHSHDHDHSSRNAALGAGAGAAALGGAAFTGTTHYDSTQKLPATENPVSLVSSAAPVPITNYEPWQPMQTEWPASHSAREPVTSGIHPTEESGAHHTHTPIFGSSTHPTHDTTSHTSHGSVIPATQDRHGHDAVEDPENRSHGKRDAALLGTAGAAALAGTGHAHGHHSTDSPAYDTQNPTTTSAYPTHGTTTDPTRGTDAYPMQGTTSHASHVPSVPMDQQRYDPTRASDDKSHNTRDAALLGTAGAATLAGAGHSHGHHSTYDSPAYDTQNPATAAYPTQGTTSHASQVPGVPVNQQRHDNVRDLDDGNHDKRNAALLGTAGAATLAGVGHSHNQPTHDSTAYNTQTPAGSSAYPTQGTTSHIPQTSAAPVTQHRYEGVDHPEDGSHDKRNAALLGTAGAAGLAGAGYAHHHNTPQSTQDPTAYNTQVPGTTAVHPSHSSMPYNTQVPTGSTTQQRYDPVGDSDKHSHDMRNAALLGTAGVAGAGYAHHNKNQPTQDPTVYNAQMPGTTAGHPTSTGYNTQAPATTTTHPRHGTVEDPTEKDHSMRNAALLGTAGATAAGAGYAHNQKQDEQDLFETQKRLAKMEKKHEIEQSKLEKTNPVLEEKEKKHGILGFLHRDKSKKEKSSPSAESTPRASRDYSRESPRASRDFTRESPRHSKEYPDPRTTAAAYEALPIDASGRNKLHKDPPQGHPARDALEHPEAFAVGGLGNRERIGVDGPIGHPNMISGDRETERNTYGAHPISDLDKDRIVIEPHTGLPMNVGRYGDGHGGTDGNATIPGAHVHDPVHTGAVGSTMIPGTHAHDNTHTGMVGSTALPGTHAHDRAHTGMVGNTTIPGSHAQDYGHTGTVGGSAIPGTQGHGYAQSGAVGNTAIPGVHTRDHAHTGTTGLTGERRTDAPY